MTIRKLGLGEDFVYLWISGSFIAISLPVHSLLRLVLYPLANFRVYILYVFTNVPKKWILSKCVLPVHKNKSVSLSLSLSYTQNTNCLQRVKL